MNNEDTILGWYEPVALSAKYGRAGWRYSIKSFTIGVGLFAASILAEWIFAPPGKMKFLPALSISLIVGFVVFLVSPVIDLLTPVYIKLSPSHLSRMPFLGDQLDIKVSDIKKCQLYSLRVLGRAYTGMLVSCADGQELAIGLSANPGKAGVLSMLKGAGVETEEIEQNA
jgi:hypothetical protein